MEPIHRSLPAARGPQVAALPAVLGFHPRLLSRDAQSTQSRALGLAFGELLVDLGRQDEIALREAVDFVSPGLYLEAAPREKQIGMMPLLFRNLAHAVGEIERCPEVGERASRCASLPRSSI